MSATGAGTYFSYEEEDDAGKLNSPSTLTKLNRLDGDGIGYEASSITDDSIRSDRMTNHGRNGNYSANKSLPFNIRYGEYDKLLEGVFGGEWTTTLDETALSVDIVASAGTITRSTGDWTTNAEVGDFVSIIGSTNNGLFQITSVTELVLTVQDFQNQLSDSTSESIDAKIEYLRNGTTKKTYSFEEGYTDASTPFYNLSLGNRAGTLSLSAGVDTLVNGSLDFTGRSLDVTDTANGDTYVSESTNETMVTYDIGYAQFSDDSECSISEFSFNIDNGLNPINTLCSRGAKDITTGRSVVTGNATIYLDDKTNLVRYINETTFPIYMKFADADNKAYGVRMPSCKLTSESRSLPENEVTQSLDFESAGVSNGYSVAMYRHAGE